ncbi:hypothetical protein DJ83_09925 [Halorubrum ezzemoulense]|uniref:Glycosyl transferase family 1 domain-containing protein n=2 Tax=Halorubrum ezzemoulense TaxID=337243 RepID=A0A256IVX1_HALEZ|nr:hypothetical protein DJ83_09925 [Halorubrum ezzemoulense]
MEKVDPDILHVHHLDFRFPPTYLERNRLYEDVPIVTAVHGFHSIKFTDGDLQKNMKSLISSNLCVAENLILNSTSVEKELEKFFSESLDKFNFYTGINAIDTNKFYQTSTDSNNTDNLLYVSRLEERKGVYTLIRALGKNKQQLSEFHCTLVGEIEDRARVETLIDRFGLNNTVSLEGRVPNLRNYYNSADLLVVPSVHEDFGLVYLEAMACGTPVIGTTGVPKEVIPSNDVGYRAEPKNPQDLYEKIKNSLDKNWEYSKIIDHAQSYSWSNKINEYKQIYSRLSKGRPIDIAQAK